jgi:glutathione synthase/RimK-type ligase-like ATP-grasp enzyme
MGVGALILDPFAPDQEARIAYSFAGGTYAFEARAGRLSARCWDVAAVWWRLKQFPEDEARAPEERFAFKEWRDALEGLEEVLARARWVNPRRADRRARHKVVQLVEANRCGFSIPPTLISNDPEQVLGHVESWENGAIYKSLNVYIQPPDKVLYTNRVTGDFIAANREAVALAPGIFQPLIRKEYELRITVVGRSVFAARINSQKSITTEVDWRRDYSALSYCLVQLPEGVQHRLLRLHDALGLVFGAYDFIVTPEHEYVFLEVNPVGAWLWIEDALGVGISRALAEVLAA